MKDGVDVLKCHKSTPEHVKRTSDGDHYRLRVPEGKNTNGGGKPRDASLPP